MYNENINDTTKEKELLKPKCDVVFQSLFTQKNEEITKAFISDLLGEQITELKINETKELFKEYPEDKLGILDLEAVVNEKEIVDIEIQLIDRKNLEKRLLRYFSKLYSIQKGKEYDELKRVVIIAIIDYKLEKTKEIEKMETIWNLREKDYKDKILTNQIEFHIIELSKGMREYKKDKSNRKAQWMLFLENPGSKEVDEAMEENKEIKKATVEVIKMSEDEKMRKLAELREKAIWDEKDIYAAGLDKGTKEGIKEGIKQGKIEDAKKMKNKGIDLKTINEITGLTIEEINNL